MIILLHKRNNEEYPVTAEVFEKIKSRPNWQATYKVIQAPPKEPKEIKETVSKAKAKKDAEFEQDGFSNNDAPIPDGDAGQEQ